MYIVVFAFPYCSHYPFPGADRYILSFCCSGQLFWCPACSGFCACSGTTRATAPKSGADITVKKKKSIQKIY
ncbi:hypothetical protein GDO81_024854 [Engystomops pustulosus]|uniref:Secreted protein n=1 Tax=Engystomops pustulosus TaxID=76066 RepID=A0AAV6ZKA5_ENGPU|nr:hypothetical protein GDO81_024854 [Engystomops pustulosus]